ncbi:MAG: hypothetical protein CVU46_15660 [Chloroflexi bacterium HGW-Chloroflexi-8]|nr:MAG: hypothetical protein CVU46_15660 [Chloroflexi bacterium HGW-Chloroflexi-8]
MESNNEIDPGLRKKLSVLQLEYERDPEKVKRGRSAFLQEAEQFAKTVSPLNKMRHNGWINSIQSIFMFRKKEHTPMFNTLMTIMLVFTLVLGGGGTTLVAAQNTQPDQPLYGIKLWSEQFRSNLTNNPQNKYQLSLEFADRRFEEIQNLFQSGGIPTEEIQNRYINQVEQTIRFAMSLSDDRALNALQQIQERLQIQNQALLQVKTDGTVNADASLTRTRLMIQERLNWIEGGLSNLNQLREQIRQQEKVHEQDPQNPESNAEQATRSIPEGGAGNPWTTGTPTPYSGYGPGDCTNCTPSGNGESNPWTTGTPTPYSGYGPGDCENCTPSGNGESNPWTTGTPTPYSGYGPGPGSDPSQTCTPGTGDDIMPQPTQQQIGQPTQAGPQPTTTGTGSQATPGSGDPGGKH